VVSRCEQLSLAGSTYFLGLLSERAFYVVFEEMVNEFTLHWNIPVWSRELARKLASTLPKQAHLVCDMDRSRAIVHI
jgi:hypothetical protein